MTNINCANLRGPKKWYIRSYVHTYIHISTYTCIYTSLHTHVNKHTYIAIYTKTVPMGFGSHLKYMLYHPTYDAYSGPDYITV